MYISKSMIFCWAVAVTLTVATAEPRAHGSHPSRGGGIFRGYPRPRIPVTRDGGDPGEPLFITPLLAAGNASEARRLARVPLTDTLGIESYSGFFTIQPEYNSNLFFWYFPSLTGNAAAPIVVWLQGGPGASSLYGLFAEHGPLRVRGDRLERRKYTWALSHHLIYIDNPVGSGFSFTNDSRGYCSDEACVGRDLRLALLQFVQLFPQLRGRELYVTGESYAGKYVPALGYALHTACDRDINLAGIAIGNGLTDPLNQLLYGDYLYQHGLLDRHQLAHFHKVEASVRDAIVAKRWRDAFQGFDELLNGDLTDGASYFYNVTGFRYYFNILHSSDPHAGDDAAWARLLASSDARRSVHVGSLPFNDGHAVEERLVNDVMQSVAPWLEELLQHYRVLIYNGQLDIIVAYPLTENYLSRLNFSGAAEYARAERHIWRVSGEVAGYVKTAANLTEVLVRNAGHMVPADRPLWALDLITRFTHHKPFYQPRTNMHLHTDMKTEHSSNHGHYKS